MASTLDGRISTQGGCGQKITNDASHDVVQRLREGIGRAGGAVLVGGNTFALDDPRLTARTPEALRQPLAAVLTTRLPSASGSAVLRERPADAVFFTSAAQAASPAAEVLRNKGARIHEVKVQGIPGQEGQAVRARLSAGQALEMLRTEEGCLYVLCEGGGKLALSLLEEGLVDELHLHLAPLILGDATATPVFSGRSVEGMADALRMRVTHTALVDGDIHLYFRADRG